MWYKGEDIMKHLGWRTHKSVDKLMVQRITSHKRYLKRHEK